MVRVRTPEGLLALRGGPPGLEGLPVLCTAPAPDEKKGIIQLKTFSTGDPSHTPPTIDPTQLRTNMAEDGLPPTQHPGAPLEPGHLLPSRRVRAVVAAVPTELVVTRVVPRVPLGRPSVRGARPPRRARPPTRCRPRRGVPPCGGRVAAPMIGRGRASRLPGVRGPTGAPARRRPRGPMRHLLTVLLQAGGNLVPDGLWGGVHQELLG